MNSNYRCAIQAAAQALSRLEVRGVSRRKRYRCTGPGIASDACTSETYRELPKPRISIRPPPARHAAMCSSIMFAAKPRQSMQGRRTIAGLPPRVHTVRKQGARIRTQRSIRPGRLVRSPRCGPRGLSSTWMAVIHSVRILGQPEDGGVSRTDEQRRLSPEHDSGAD